MPKPKGPPRVMDVVHPSIGRRPSPTSRPVILPDRAYMAVDPMLSGTDTSAERDTSPTSDKNDTVELSGAPELLKDAQTTVGLPLSSPHIRQPEQTEPESLETDVETRNTSIVSEPAEATRPASSASSDPTEARLKTSNRVESTSAPTETLEDTSDQESDDEATDSETDTGISAEPLQAQQAQSPDEAALKAREDELERMISAGTYAVPINTVKRRQARLLLIVLGAVLALLIAVDLLADMQIITLPFGLPHTSFLAH